MHRTVVIATVLLVAALSFLTGWLVGRGQTTSAPEPAADARAAHAVGRLKATLHCPESLQVLAVTANKTAVPEDVMVEVDFLAEGTGGQAPGKFWVLWQSGWPTLTGWSSWPPGEEPGHGDRAGLFKAN